MSPDGVLLLYMDIISATLMHRTIKIKNTKHFGGASMKTIINRIMQNRTQRRRAKKILPRGNIINDRTVRNHRKRYLRKTDSNGFWSILKAQEHVLKSLR